MTKNTKKIVLKNQGRLIYSFEKRERQRDGCIGRSDRKKGQNKNALKNSQKTQTEKTQIGKKLEKIEVLIVSSIQREGEVKSEKDR